MKVFVCPLVALMPSQRDRREDGGALGRCLNGCEHYFCLQSCWFSRPLTCPVLSKSVSRPLHKLTKLGWFTNRKTRLCIDKKWEVVLSQASEYCFLDRCEVLWCFSGCRLSCRHPAWHSPCDEACDGWDHGESPLLLQGATLASSNQLVVQQLSRGFSHQRQRV